MALLLGLLAVEAAPAQPSALRLDGWPTQQTLQRWDKRSGLPQNGVQALARTADGYVWIGLLEGLVRFDGKNFTPFASESGPDLGSVQINALFAAHDGRLWVGTPQGAMAVTGTAVSPPLAMPSLDEKEVYDLAEDRVGTLYVATLSGVLRYGERTPTVLDARAGLEDARALAIAFDTSNRLWVGTPTGVFRQDGRRFVRAAPAEATGLVRVLFDAPDGTLYVGAETGLMRVAGGSVVPVPWSGREACAPVRSIASDPQGMLWIGMRNRGACALKDGHLVPVTPEQGVPAGDLRALLSDREGGFWLGSEGGLARLRRGRFSTFGTLEGLPGHGASVVYQDARGAVWVGTVDGGLVRFVNGEMQTFGRAQGLAGLTVTALAEYDGTLWASANDEQGGGLCRFDASGQRFRCTHHPGQPDRDVVFALNAFRGTLWAGTREGVARWNGRTLDLLPDSLAGLHGKMVNALVDTPDGSLWAGTIQGGLVRYLGGEATRARAYTQADGLASTDVVVLHVDERGTLWVGLKSSELCRLPVGQARFRCYGAAQGLSGSQIMQVLSDRRGNLWIGSNSGYERIPLAAFDRPDGGLPVERVAAGEDSGLRDPEAYGAVQPSAFRLRDGRLAFATVGGLGLFDPAMEARYANLVPPPVYVEQVRTNRSTLVPGPGVLVLPTGERNLHVVLAVVAFSSPEKVAVRYRLSGSSDEWQTLEAGSRTISLSTLAPGTYRLHVQAANAEGVWNTEGTTLAFRVPPRFYETNWFYALLPLVGLALIVQAVRWRMQSLVARQQELEHVVNERTAELQASQTELLARERELETVNEGLEAEVRRQVENRLEERQHYEQELIVARDEAVASARLKETILNNMSHEIRTPITAILGFAEVLTFEVEGEAAEFVRYIDENGKRLLTTLNTVLDFSHLEGTGVQLKPTDFDVVPLAERVLRLFDVAAERKGIALARTLPDALVATSDHFGIERIVTHLVANAVKFTDKGEVRFDLSATDEALTLVVSDTGCGIGEAFLPDLYVPFQQESGGLARQHEGTGLGLSIVRQYVDAMGGTIAVETAKDAGTTFTVVLPRRLTARPAAKRVPALA